ncbi:HlyD family efflux transporter periplasmic adaptor subunit [Microbulbifer sediminum]|uniref:HlyD family efflux transporter periplasmic adaptor subunit n=1 Tax=Microbulbifer sediminum TaxID=2904250 RepID=UPI001F39F91E|nr:HlyD family efflux transporter periplasmic adaptor subunit [Microbulbifer sediminum]
MRNNKDVGVFGVKGLFRHQAVDAQRERLLGEISLAQPVSMQVTLTCIVFLVVLVLLFLSVSNYSRKETVHGYLNPSHGVLKVYSKQGGTLENLHVSEGKYVQKGDDLATVVLTMNSISGESVAKYGIEKLQEQIESIGRERENYLYIFSREKEKLQRRIKNARETLVAVIRQEELARQKVALISGESKKYQSLHSQGYISEADLKALEERSIAARQDLERLTSSRIGLKSDLNTYESDLEILPAQKKIKLAEYRQRESGLHNQLIQARSNYRHVIKAPKSGVVTAIQVVEGEFVTSARPMMSVIPEESDLLAELFLPTRSAGFVKVGDTAKIRFDAFPYQRFGFLQAEIVQIDKALISKADANLPFQLSEPVYRLKARLDQQEIDAYGDSYPLKAGMLFEADIILDRRSLLDWFLNPIYSLKGRVG